MTLDTHVEWTSHRTYTLHLDYGEMEALRQVVKDETERRVAAPVLWDILEQLKASDAAIRKQT